MNPQVLLLIAVTVVLLVIYFRVKGDEGQGHFFRRAWADFCRYDSRWIYTSHSGAMSFWNGLVKVTYKSCPFDDGHTVEHLILNSSRAHARRCISFLRGDVLPAETGEVLTSWEADAAKDILEVVREKVLHLKV